jgi:hypothetical protein
MASDTYTLVWPQERYVCDIEITYSHISKMDITAVRITINKKTQKTTERTGTHTTQYKLGLTGILPVLGNLE